MLGNVTPEPNIYRGWTVHNILHRQGRKLLVTQYICSLFSNTTSPHVGFPWWWCHSPIFYDDGICCYETSLIKCCTIWKKLQPFSSQGSGDFWAQPAKLRPPHNFYRFSQDSIGCKVVAINLDRLISSSL